MRDEDCTILQVEGLKCPLPVLKLRKMMKDLPASAMVKMIATDPASMQDVQNFCDSNGHKMLQQIATDDGKFIHYLQKEDS